MGLLLLRTAVQIVALATLGGATSESSNGLAAGGAAGLLYYTPGGPKRAVSFNERSAIIGGQPTMMLSGAVHYTRVHEEEWGRVFKLAVDMGLNVIQTYVFWNAHETSASQVGNATWEGRANLPRFIELAGTYGLWVNVRIGPYIWYAGTWLRLCMAWRCVCVRVPFV